MAAPTLLTNRQVPEHSIMDAYSKQSYLGSQFLYSTGSLSVTGTSETPILLISNPAVPASAFPSGWQALFLNYLKGTCVTSSQSVIFRYYANPTVSAVGTAKTPVNVRTAATTTQIAVVTQSPTISANGTYLTALSSSAFIPDSSNLLWIIDPGQTVLVTAQATATASIILDTAFYQL